MMVVWSCVKCGAMWKTDEAKDPEFVRTIATLPHAHCEQPVVGQRTSALVRSSETA